MFYHVKNSLDSTEKRTFFMPKIFCVLDRKKMWSRDCNIRKSRVFATVSRHNFFLDIGHDSWLAKCLFMVMND